MRWSVDGGYSKTKEVLAMNDDEGPHLVRNKLHNMPGKQSAVELLRSTAYLSPSPRQLRTPTDALA